MNKNFTKTAEDSKNRMQRLISYIDGIDIMKANDYYGISSELTHKYIELEAALKELLKEEGDFMNSIPI